ncbi:MAG: XRE family transcriptional regulator [Deltaproteobacteria bacterium]|nr:XRE family transcriptional regulator [Deltaproteobacteria bacterium]
MAKFPSEAELKEIRSKTNLVRGTAMLAPNATPLEKAKFELCKQLIIYMQDHGLSQRQLAEELGVVESRISEVVHYRIRKLTLDRLVKYHQTLDPDFALKVA